MIKSRLVTIIALLSCVALAISLVWMAINYSTVSEQIKDLDSEIDDLKSQLVEYKYTIDSQNSTIVYLENELFISNRKIENLTWQMGKLEDQLDSANSQIINLNSTISYLKDKIYELEKTIANWNTSSELQTLILHFCEKGEGYEWGRLPDVNYTYNQFLNLNNGKYDVLILPEYKGNLNWTETSTWLKQNFSDIPIMLSIFEGGNQKLPSPNIMLNVSQISEAMTWCDVRALRIAEMVSWYIEQNQTFPTDYFTDILSFADANDLWVLWSEWKVGDSVFEQVENYIIGFEDVVTVAFQTNSGDLEPAEGFELARSLFQHWGGSIQSWYWVTRGLGNETEMPASMFLQHTLAAYNFGAEILQFEPYWYFFENGEPNENVKILMTTLTLIKED